MARITVGNRYSKIEGLPNQYVEEAVRRELSYQVQNYFHMPAYKERGWDGYIHLLEADGLFMSGLLSLVRSVLESTRTPCEIIDTRVCQGQNFPELAFTPPPDYQERPYQKYTIDRAIRHTRGILRVATGGGKTMIVTEMIGRLKVRPFLFFVLTRDLLIQAHDELGRCLNTPIGMVGDGKMDIQDITVCTVQTMVACLHRNDKSFDPKEYRYDADDVWDESQLLSEGDSEKVVALLRECRGFYFDEVHHAAARTCREIVFACENAYYRYGGSATPQRDDGEDLVVQGLFGKRIVDISATYLMDQGFLVRGHVFLTNRDPSACGETTYGEIYKKVVVENEDFNGQVADLVKFLVYNGVPCLILVQRIPHGKLLKKFLPEAEYLTGRDTGKRRKKVIDRMRRGDLMVLIATTLADEGLDIKPIQAVFMLSAGASVTRVPQRIGRCLRLWHKKKHGMFIYFRHRVKYLFEQGHDVQKILATEPGFVVHKAHDFAELRQEIAGLMNSSEKLL